jgi:hypothetical protein
MLVSGPRIVIPTAAVPAAPASVSGSRGSCSRHDGRVAWAGRLVGEFSGLYLLLLTLHMLIFACRVCLGASPVLGRADASYCCSLPATSRALYKGGTKTGGGRGCRIVWGELVNI